MLPLRMVGVEEGAPSGGGPLPGRKACREASAPRRSAVRDCRDRARRSKAHRRAQWALVRPLLPPQRGGIGRAPNDHRVVLGGILWVARTGSSWREMPEEYGKWETAYRRYELWTKQGLWQRILRVLGEEDLPGPATKKPK